MQARMRQFWPPPQRDAAQGTERPCDRPGCHGHGEFRAPKSRESLGDFYWFCLDHVRDYNRAWDFCAGMSEADIERLVRADVTWQRASWPLGRLTGGGFMHIDPERIKDSFGLFGEGFWRKPSKPPAKQGPEEKAKRVMEIKDPLTVASLKARYKELCKRYHPDANGGDKVAEERFKEVGQAYRTLLASLSY